MLYPTNWPSAIRWIPAINNTPARAPAFAACVVVGCDQLTVTSDGRMPIQLQVQRPKFDSILDMVVFNGPVPMEPNGLGLVTRDFPAHALISPNSDSIGSLGTKAGKWYLDDTQVGFIGLDGYSTIALGGVPSARTLVVNDPLVSGSAFDGEYFASGFLHLGGGTTPPTQIGGGVVIPRPAFGNLLCEAQFDGGIAITPAGLLAGGTNSIFGDIYDQTNGQVLGSGQVLEFSWQLQTILDQALVAQNPAVGSFNLGFSATIAGIWQPGGVLPATLILRVNASLQGSGGSGFVTASGCVIKP